LNAPVKPSRPYHPGYNPAQLTPTALRQRLLRLAGITEEKQGKIVKAAVGTMVRKLRAKKQIVQPTGNGSSQLVDIEDNMAQLRAAEGLARLMGVEPSKDVNAGNVKVLVEVKLPDWAKPAVTIDATPEHEPDITDVNEPIESTG
jgi:hypothetical protein